jgi:uncharacterized protein (TIGR02594 family)
MKTLRSNIKFSWLLEETAPKVIVEAVKHYDVTEIPGSKSNSIILGWAKKLKISWYENDDTPWCGLFISNVVTDAGYVPVKNALRALSWVDWGNGVSLKDASLGDVLVFKRPGGGHVGLYVGEEKDFFYVLGGNQSNQVNVGKIAKSRCVAVRRSPWRVGQPLQVRKIFVENGGVISKNEV